MELRARTLFVVLARVLALVITVYGLVTFVSALVGMPGILDQLSPGQTSTVQRYSFTAMVLAAPVTCLGLGPALLFLAPALARLLFWEDRDVDDAMISVEVLYRLTLSLVGVVAILVAILAAAQAAPRLLQEAPVTQPLTRALAAGVFGIVVLLGRRGLARVLAKLRRAGVSSEGEKPG